MKSFDIGTYDIDELNNIHSSLLIKKEDLKNSICFIKKNKKLCSNKEKVEKVLVFFIKLYKNIYILRLINRKYVS